MTLVLLVCVGGFSLHVVWRYHRQLDRSAWLTILVYLGCILTKLGYSIYDISTVGQANPKGVFIPSMTASATIIMVFYYIIYELRIVQLKLECQSLQQFVTKLSQAKIFLWVSCVLQVVSLGLKVWADQFSEAEKDALYSGPWRVFAAATFISLVMDELQVALLWFYFVYFFRKKKLFLARQRRQFTQNEKVAVVWMIIVLISNSVNFSVDNVLSVIFLFRPNLESFEQVWRIFVHFWFNLLILNNGLTMLALYRQMALIQIRQEAALGRQENPSAAGFDAIS